MAEGYSVVATSDADDAITVLVSRNDIHIIITEVNMPGSMDSLSLAIAVKDRWPLIKIIVTTGRAPPASDQMLVDGVFMAKPYNSETIKSTVAEIFRLDQISFS